MGILSWWRKGSNNNKTPSVSQPTQQKPDPKPTSSSSEKEEVPGMNGAVEVPRRNPELDVMVFEFGSVKASTDKVTLTGYCPVSEEIEPCRWEILPARDSDAPQFRVVF